MLVPHFRRIRLAATDLLKSGIRPDPAYAALRQAGQAIERAIDLAIKAPEGRTRDLGGTLGTKAFASCVAANLAEAAKAA
ncbi:hypothetical protein OIU35_22655 [Boseaceae bacterium BT-24-1]|nr:hypothetical protein [Boseaceae bacterium BT-24-1]